MSMFRYIYACFLLADSWDKQKHVPNCKLEGSNHRCPSALQWQYRSQQQLIMQLFGLGFFFPFSQIDNDNTMSNDFP